jgi:CAAX amino terminal protease family.
MKKKGLFWLLGVYICVLFLGAELAAVAYAWMQYVDGPVHVDWIRYLAHKPLCQYVDRFRIVGFFLLLPYICKKCHIQRKNLGLRFSLKKYIMAFCFGCALWIFLFGVSIAVIGGVAPKSALTIPLLPIFGASFLLALLEEIIFRGVVFEFFRKNYSEILSMCLLALLFASLHFSICTPGNATNVFLHATQCAYNSLVAISHIQWTYFICLLLLSCLLVRLRLKFNSLWVCIGFHQGLVFVLMLLRKRYTFTNYGSCFWGSGHITDAWFSVIVLMGIWCVLECYWRSHEKNT